MPSTSQTNNQLLAEGIERQGTSEEAGVTSSSLSAWHHNKPFFV